MARRNRSRPARKPAPSSPSFLEKVRNLMLGLGQIAIEIASLGARDTGGWHHEVRQESYADSPRARTWYGRILQWAWALLVFLVGLVCLVIALIFAADWVMSWFR